MTHNIASCSSSTLSHLLIGSRWMFWRHQVHTHMRNPVLPLGLSRLTAQTQTLPRSLPPGSDATPLAFVSPPSSPHSPPRPSHHHPSPLSPYPSPPNPRPSCGAVQVAFRIAAHVARGSQVLRQRCCAKGAHYTPSPCARSALSASCVVLSSHRSAVEAVFSRGSACMS